MKRFFIAILLALCLCTFILPAASAQNLPEYRQVDLVADDAGLLSPASVDELESLALQVSEAHGCDVGVFFARSYYPYSSINDFVDDYFDFNGFGYGPTQNGILFVVTTDEREYRITTGGIAIDAFTDYGLSRIEEQVVSYLSSGNWSGAAKKFIRLCDDYLKEYESGGAYDTNNTVKTPVSLQSLGISGVLGFILSGLPLRKSKKELTSVTAQRNASEYRIGPKITVTEQDDRYINNSIVRVPIPRDDGHDHGPGRPGGGGSSIHISSSGVSHGGHGGHF